LALKKEQIIEGDFHVANDGGRRDPIIVSWWGIPRLLALFGAAYLMWHTIYPWMMAHVHIQISDLLGRH
jgi:hypothetical protein